MGGLETHLALLIEADRGFRAHPDGGAAGVAVVEHGPAGAEARLYLRGLRPLCDPQGLYFYEAWLLDPAGARAAVPLGAFNADWDGAARCYGRLGGVHADAVAALFDSGLRPPVVVVSARPAGDPPAPGPHGALIGVFGPPAPRPEIVDLQLPRTAAAPASGPLPDAAEPSPGGPATADTDGLVPAAAVVAAMEAAHAQGGAVQAAAVAVIEAPPPADPATRSELPAAAQAETPPEQVEAPAAQAPADPGDPPDPVDRGWTWGPLDNAPHLAPLGYRPVQQVHEALLPGRESIATATGDFQIDFGAGTCLATVRSVPPPAAWGMEATTGRPYNVYQAWVRNSRTDEWASLGFFRRIWSDTYRLYYRGGVPLHLYDELIVSAEDRAGSADPAKVRLFIGSYRSYERVPRG